MKGQKKKIAAMTKMIGAMSLQQRRGRLEELRRMAAKGDYSYEYDEVVILKRNIPEEKAADVRADARRVRNAKRRAKRQGLFGK